MKRILVPALCCWLALTTRAAVPPAEKLLPDTTQFVLTIPDFTKARDVYIHSPQVQLWQDPAMKPFREKLWGKFSSDMLAPLERQLGVHFDDFTNLLQGQITLALLPGKPAAGEHADMSVELLLILDTRDKSAQLKSQLAELKKKWVDAGKALRTEKIRDLEFAVISPPTEGAAKDAKEDKDAADKLPAKPAEKNEFYIGQADSLLLVSTATQPIESVLAALAGSGARPLDELPSFASQKGSLFRGATFFGWLNTKPLVDALIKQDEGVKEIEADTNPFSFKWAKVVSATGLGGLKSVAFSYSDSPEGGQFNGALGVPESARTGIFKILAGEPKETKPPTFVPADAVKFTRWRLDGQKSWATLLKAVGEISPQWLGSLNLGITMAEASAKEKDPDFSIKKNFIGNLGDDIITYSKAPKSSSAADIAAAPNLMLIGSPNGEQIALSLKSIFALLGSASGTTAEREFRGHKIYSLPLPTMPGSAGGAPLSFNYCASGGYLALSADTAMLEEYLRSSENQEKSLRDNPSLAEAMQKVSGDGTCLFGYADQTADMRALFELLRSNGNPVNALGSASAAAMLLGGQGPAKLKEWSDFSQLPPFDQLAKYFSYTVYAAGANQDGLFLKVFMPTPPQLKGH